VTGAARERRPAVTAAALAMALATAGAAVALAACASDAPLAIPTPPGPGSELRRFDLVPRGHDDNCLPLNPQLGWSYLETCSISNAFTRVFMHPSPDDVLDPENPARCSWVFGNSHARPGRPACNSGRMDPDFGDSASTTFLAVTCADSMLHYPGHLNWDKVTGGAVTYEGWLSWESFSGTWPGDYDLNFVLTLEKHQAPASTWDWITAEMDSRELGELDSPWWRDLLARIKAETAGEYVNVRYALVTGLLGIDAEHMSETDPNLELHPVYALAIRVCPEASCRGGRCSPEKCAAGTERWALFARERGNEGSCSHHQHHHVLAQVGGVHTFRLPWRSGMTGVRVRQPLSQSVFCNSGVEGNAGIEVVHDEEHQVLLVVVKVPPGGIVDGELYLEWQGNGGAPPPAPRRKPRTGSPREQEDRGVTEQRARAAQAIVQAQLAKRAAVIAPPPDTPPPPDTCRHRLAVTETSSHTLVPRTVYANPDCPPREPAFDEACRRDKETAARP
jgi:hypothetical protein